MVSSPLLHYESHGDPSDAAVLFLHGFMGSTRDWDEVIQRLNMTCYCIAIDLPGHGKSLGFLDSDIYTVVGATRGVVRTMKQADVIPATIVGYSMGGRVALYLAMHYGGVCSKLVIESATAGISESLEREKRRQLDEERAKELEQGRFEDFLRTWYCQPVFETLAKVPERLETVLKRRHRNDPAELAKALRGMSVGIQPSLWGQLSNLAMPVLVLAGERDQKYVDVVRAMAALLPHVAIEIVPGAGHNVHLEQPTLVADHVKNFVLKE